MIDRFSGRFEENISKRTRGFDGEKLSNVRRIEHELRTLSKMHGLCLNGRLHGGVLHVGHIAVIGIGEIEEDVVVRRCRLSLLLVSEDQVDPIAEIRGRNRRIQRLEVLGNEQRRRALNRDVVNGNIVLRGSERQAVFIQQEMGVEEPLRNELFDFGRVF